MLKNLLNKKINKEVLQYLIVGVWNTLFSLGLYFALVYITRNLGKYAYSYIGLISGEIAIIQSFLSYKFFVFKTKGNYFKEYIKCRAVYGIATLVTYPILIASVETCRYLLPEQYKNLSPYIGGIISSGVSVIFSYFGHKNFTFKRKSNLQS
ncbi:MAG: GtrA family protein [Alphaproteobacteria bacterium]|nr:GtrA family protein [Alphaproteobacteria bacterium]